jgi:hypothetical protein
MVPPGITQQEAIIRDRRHWADKRHILWTGALRKSAIA